MPEAVWVAQMELSDPDPRVDAPRGYAAARVLVRIHGVPLGLVVVRLRDGVCDAQTLRETVEAELGDRVTAHLRADGLAAVDDRPQGPHACGRPGDHAPATPFASVCVCTRDRDESLRAALRSILDVDYPSFEVVVVDSASETDRTRTVVDALGDPRLRYVRAARPGLSRARNLAMAEARADLIAFTDDDVRVDPGWLRGLARGFTRAPGVGAVSGPVVAAELDTASQRTFEDRVQWANIGPERIYSMDDDRRDRPPLFPYTAGRFGTGANFAVSREAVLRVGGFDEALGAGTPARGGEDLDYFVRVLRAGCSFAVEPGALVWHYHRREAQALDRQLFGYGAGLTAYAFKQLFRSPALLEVLRTLVTRTGGGAGAGFGGVTRARGAELRGLGYGPVGYVRGRLARGR